MILKTETYKSQSSIAQFCRDGKELYIMGARTERLPYYRRLVFNVVKDALETTYPIAYKYIDNEFWNTLVYDFFANHKCQDPQVWRMPKEFLEFCKRQDYAELFNLPYLNDLLYFEWLEADIYMMEDINYPAFSESIDWDNNNKIAVNPEHKIIKLEYPVHLENPEVATNKKGDYFLLIYREKDSGKVQFISLSVLFTFLLENIVLGEKNLAEIFNDILLIFGINDIRLLKKESYKFLDDLNIRGFVLGLLQE